jgi:SAM-dependent methyltransferase
MINNCSDNSCQTDKNDLRKLFFKNVPKARSINPFFVEQFNLIYDASRRCKNGENILNIICSRDLSSVRADFYRRTFFANSTYYEIDFWRDQFMKLGSEPVVDAPIMPYRIDFEDNSFEVVVTTKIIMEHVSNPSAVFRELFRVLKPGGMLFLIAPHIRRQHQAPYDYYRFTEYSLEMLLKSAGYSSYAIGNTGGFMAVVGYYFYFFQRGLAVPRYFMHILDLIHHYLIEPIFFFLDRIDNGYGRDMTMYFTVRAQK